MSPASLLGCIPDNTCPVRYTNRRLASADPAASSRTLLSDPADLRFFLRYGCAA